MKLTIKVYFLMTSKKLAIIIPPINSNDSVSNKAGNLLKANPTGPSDEKPSFDKLPSLIISFLVQTRFLGPSKMVSPSISNGSMEVYQSRPV